MSVSLCTLWRSVWLPRAVTAVALVVGLPLFLRSPPWCDVTLYEMAARNLLHGGVHYRDLFDTNLPGFVWALTVIDWLFGPSVIAVRIVDLLVVLGVVLLIERLAKWGGATLATRWWILAGTAVFYPFTVENSHAQRDTWMMLPALTATLLRVRRGMGSPAESAQPPATAEEKKEAAPAIDELSRTGETDHTPALAGSPAPESACSEAERPEGDRTGLSILRESFLEGMLWGAAVWMKPHIVPVALAVWILSAWRLAGEHPRPWRAAAFDLLGNLLGGLAVGLPGVIWLMASSAWDAFLDVFLNWNPRYMQLANQEFDGRLDMALDWFPPWSFGLIVTVPLAVASVLDAALWRKRAPAGSSAEPGVLGRWLPHWLWDSQADADARFARAILSGLYLACAAQSLLIQRQFLYVHVPETLLMFGVWAAHRWSWVPVMLAWLALASGLWLVADQCPTVKGELESLPPATREQYLPRHVISDPDRLRLWPRCWRLNMTDAERYALWDALRLHPPHEASIGWEELGEVADFLRSKNVKDGEVIAWFDSPHAVYLLLDIDPGFRYMHVYTAISISGAADKKALVGRKRVYEDLAKATRAKYVVSDLEWVASSHPERRDALLGPPRDPPHDLLPVERSYPEDFPFNQPTVFRSRHGTGRYIVHRIVTRCDNP